MATAAIPVPTPLWTSEDARIDLSLFTDRQRKVSPANASGSAIRLVLEAPSGATVSYAATGISASVGTFYVNLTGTNHTEAGNWNAQLRQDGITKQDYVIEFRTRI